MLTEASYHTAWLAYAGATVLALLILYLWVGPRLSRGARLAWALLLAALALTPAHPAADTATWAPALFVAGFELLTSGTEAAFPALRSVLIAEGMAVTLCVLCWLVLRLLRRAPDADTQSTS